VNGAGNLAGVTCISAADCWAVGHYYNSASGFDQTLIEHWNGASWSVVSSPNSSSQYNHLNGVSCSSSSNCAAVGYYQSGIGGPGFTLIEHWDGASWSIVTSPNGGINQSSSL